MPRTHSSTLYLQLWYPLGYSTRLPLRVLDEAQLPCYSTRGLLDEAFAVGPEPPRHPLTLIKPTYVQSKDNNLTCLPHCYRPTNILNFTRPLDDSESTSRTQTVMGNGSTADGGSRDGEDAIVIAAIGIKWIPTGLLYSAMDKRNKGYSARTELERLLGEASR